jgi:hypothetical protein
MFVSWRPANLASLASLRSLLEVKPSANDFPALQLSGQVPFHVRTTVHCRLGGAPIFAKPPHLILDESDKSIFLELTFAAHGNHRSSPGAHATGHFLNT